MAPPQEATDIISCKKLQYCRFADLNQLHGLDNIMLPDVKCEFFDAHGAIQVEGGFEYRFASRDEFKGFFGKVFAQVQTIHIVSGAEFEEVGPDEIKAVWTLLYHASSKELSTGMHATGGGHYHETWKRKGDDWFMQSMVMNRLFYKIAV
ncbi:hypothetical protein B0J13DRAFT_532642 [Dactylonectria estremocensis]|uniref:SnoaL-like domain-containing protein n=1 Tax=Dactylonectria estremocensis TaxID=1079267 RepID=A0A9P9DG44_9HYPO|nr:hypothetical protein B0J13DRAFT_532642 [Dactylonectria estremocensis]